MLLLRFPDAPHKALYLETVSTFGELFHQIREHIRDENVTIIVSQLHPAETWSSSDILELKNVQVPVSTTTRTSWIVKLASSVPVETIAVPKFRHTPYLKQYNRWDKESDTRDKLRQEILLKGACQQRVLRQDAQSVKEQTMKQFEDDRFWQKVRRPEKPVIVEEKHSTLEPCWKIQFDCESEVDSLTIPSNQISDWLGLFESVKRSLKGSNITQLSIRRQDTRQVWFDNEPDLMEQTLPPAGTRLIVHCKAESKEKEEEEREDEDESETEDE